MLLLPIEWVAVTEDATNIKDEGVGQMKRMKKVFSATTILIK